MSIQANPNNLLIGRGKAYFDRYVNNVPTGNFRFLGNAMKFEITPSTTEKDRYDMTQKSSPLLATVTTQQDHKFTIDLDEFTKENVALALFGTTSVVTQGTTPVTSETIFTGLAGTLLPDTVLRLKNRNVPFTGTGALVLTATGSGSPTALVLGTDYEAEDSEMGLIHILPTYATVTLASTTLITAAYTPTTGTFNRVAAGVDTNIHGALIYKGDPVNGPAQEVEVWNLRIKTSGAIALITDDYGSLPLEGRVIADTANHPNSPLYQVTYR